MPTFLMVPSGEFFIERVALCRSLILLEIFTSQSIYTAAKPPSYLALATCYSRAKQRRKVGSISPLKQKQEVCVTVLHGVVGGQRAVLSETLIWGVAQAKAKQHFQALISKGAATTQSQKWSECQCQCGSNCKCCTGE